VSRWENKSLVTEYSVPHLGHADDVRDEWTLSVDRQALTVTRVTVMPDAAGTKRRYVDVMVYLRSGMH
jgi:hypothetical protein